MSSDLLRLADALRGNGEAYAMATVVRAVAPTSAKPGDKALISSDGRLHGWIGGSCAEPTVRREAAAALADGRCRLIQLAADTSAARDGPGLTVAKMSCYSGGTLEIYIEPTLAKPRFLVFGNSPVAEALVRLGDFMRFAVTLVDLSDRPPLAAASVVQELSDLDTDHLDRTYAVVATHGTFDEDALEWVLRHDVPYVGLVASARRFESVRAILTERGVPEAQIGRIRSPAGLGIGASLPQEIALSVMAEIVSTRRLAPMERPTETPTVAQDTLADPHPADPDGSCCSETSSESSSCCHE